MSVLTAVEAWWVWRMYDDQRTSTTAYRKMEITR